MDAKPSRYLGVQFRSRLEARWGVFLTHYHQINSWQYEPVTIATKGGQYTPDFHIKLLDGRELYLEVKPVKVSDETYSWLMSDVADTLKHPLALCIGSFYSKDIRIVYRVSSTQVRIDSFEDFFKQGLHGHSIADRYRFDLHVSVRKPSKKFKKRLKNRRRKGR